MKKYTLPIVLMVFIITVSVLSCGIGEPEFGIYLADTGELVLSEQHIKAYHRNVHLTASEEEDTHAIELNKAGIEKWDSYMTYEGIPKLEDTLYKRGFILKIEGKEIYRGKFYSMASSAIFGGVVILDALVKLNDNDNRIYISYGYPVALNAGEKDPRNSPVILNYLDSHGLLK